METNTSTFTVMQKYGVPRSAALYIMNNIWNVKPDDLDLFKDYYLLHWGAQMFESKFGDGLLHRNGVQYQVIYHRTNVPEVKKYKGILHLSFRELQPEYDALPTVLVSLESPR